MPEASIDEHRDSRAAKYDIRYPSWLRQQLNLQPISQTESAEGTTKFGFCTGVTLAHTPQTPTRLRRRWNDVSHLEVSLPASRAVVRRCAAECCGR